MATHLDLEEQEQIDQLKHFWNKWGTPITAVAVVVMAGFAGWNGWQYWQQRQAMEAAGLAEAVAVAVKSGDKNRLEQAFVTMTAEYPKTIQAGQSALLVGKAALDQGNKDMAKRALQWAVDNAKDEGFQATAKLRLAAILMEEKELDAAAALLRGNFPVEFRGLAVDRLGDVLQAQGKKDEAIAAYLDAWKALDDQEGYRAMVGFKLNALGAATPAAAIATVNSSEIK